MRIFAPVVPALVIAAVLFLAGGSSAQAAQPVTLWFPWEGGGLWTYTQGPHGQAFEALDFQPPDAGGRSCDFISSFWATASADGTVSIRPNGVEIDHGEGFGTGYYHLGNIQVSEGQKVVAGERLGNPGCCPDGPVQGCWATGPHLHFYTTYRGARQPIAGINLGGWQISGDGCLSRAEQSICLSSRIVSNSPDPVGAGGPADIVVLLDTSWSVGLGPGDATRHDVALALLDAVREDDRMSIINFNSRVQNRASMRTVASDGQMDPLLGAAVQSDDDFGRTDLRLALNAACREIVSRGESSKRAVVLISDGRDTVNRDRNPQECLSHHGIPVFSYRLGDDEAPLLESISESTGGSYRPLNEVRNLYCEFRMMRAVLAGEPPGRCSALRIEPGDMLSLPFNIPANQDGATLEIRWRSRIPTDEASAEFTMKASIQAPSRTKLPIPYPGIEVTEEAGSILFSIVRPVHGTWTLSVGSENLPEGGIYVTFTGVNIPQAPPPLPPEPPPTEEPTAAPTHPPSDTTEPSPSDEPRPDESETPVPTPSPSLTPDPQPTATEPPTPSLLQMELETPPEP
ncbi:MAG TPA: VWA domain-containing protein [Dehalococcoidia bacterium]|nr:VWA domain-containing protein [Dehalococcoidia bacterium]